MQFSHARKLFLFDLSLIGMLLTVLGALVFWSTYNPTVTDLVYLTISPSETRILSGEYVTYTITYQNSSSIRLKNATLAVEFPPGYSLDKTDPMSFDRVNNMLNIGSVDPNAQGIISFSGWFYGTPDLEDRLQAQLSYQQDGKTNTETKTSPHSIFLRGSLLGSSIELPEQIIEGSRIPFKITLVNNGKDPLLNISYALNSFNTIGTVENISTTRGSVSRDSWNLSGLLPHESTTLEGTLIIADTLLENKYALELAPALLIRGKPIIQSIIKKEIRVAHPEAQVSTVWNSELGFLKPGETGRLIVTIKNTGSIALDQGVLEIPLPNTVVNLSEAARANVGTLNHNTLILTSGKYAGLNSLAPGESRTVTILIPILDTPDGSTDTVLQPTVLFRAGVSGIQTKMVEANSQPAQLKVGTQMIVTGEIRYYTLEGDQLGRGPLPPQVGKETKYAALFSIRNTTSDIDHGVFTAKLPAYVVWTGKSSVTKGSAPTYNPLTHMVTWNVGTLPAHATMGLFFELGLTPLESQKGTIPVIVTNAEISGIDTYLGYQFSRKIETLDASLITDPIGRNKGATVRE